MDLHAVTAPPLPVAATGPAAAPAGPPGAVACGPPSVRVASVVADDHLLVVLQGDVDVAAEPALAALAPLVAALGLPVVVDASRVVFLDCSGLRAVLALGRDAPGLTLRRAAPAVQRVLRLTGELQAPGTGVGGGGAGVPRPAG